MPRSGQIILISDKKGIEFLKDKISLNIEIEESNNIVISSILSILPVQLLAYYISKERGNNVDKPRNLAKSVTVE